MQDFGEGKMTAGRIVVRKADRKDGAAFADLVRSLAEYERLPLPEDEQLRRIIEHAFGRKKLFELLIAYSGKEAVGYTVFFMTYSTFLARPTLFIYLTDIILSNGGFPHWAIRVIVRQDQ